MLLGEFGLGLSKRLPVQVNFAKETWLLQSRRIGRLDERRSPGLPDDAEAQAAARIRAINARSV